MSRFVFLFGLDMIVAKEEILTFVAKSTNQYEKIIRSEQQMLKMYMPFKQSFLNKVEIFKDIPVPYVQDIVSNISLNMKLVDFIKKNMDRCYIITSNIDLWIEGLIGKIGISKNTYCSKALQNKNGYIQDIVNIVDKGAVARQIVMPFVAVGNGNNDSEMIEQAEIGIGFGGCGTIAPSVLEYASHAAYDEERLVYFLEELL